MSKLQNLPISEKSAYGNAPLSQLHPTNVLVSEMEVESCRYLVRVGVLGQVGRFQALNGEIFKRGDRVVCRTARGVEVGNVLGSTQGPYSAESIDGRLLRKFTMEDTILWGHLSELASHARDACQNWLDERGLVGLLIDVEPLLDGKTLYFHFLSDVSTEIQSQLDELATVYERSVRKSRFAQLLEQGCGPGCGTETAEKGCGTSKGCAVCQIASQCGKSKAAKKTE